MNATKEFIYAAVGAGDIAIEKAKSATSSLDPAELRKLRQLDLNELRTTLSRAGSEAFGRTVSVYGQLVERGERTVKGIRNSNATKRAVAQTKTARSQTKSAVTSAKKAATSTVEATKQAASNL